MLEQSHLRESVQIRRKSFQWQAIIVTLAFLGTTLIGGLYNEGVFLRLLMATFSTIASLFIGQYVATSLVEPGNADVDIVNPGHLTRSIKNVNGSFSSSCDALMTVSAAALIGGSIYGFIYWDETTHTVFWTVTVLFSLTGFSIGGSDATYFLLKDCQSSGEALAEGQTLKRRKLFGLNLRLNTRPESCFIQSSLAGCSACLNKFNPPIVE